MKYGVHVTAFAVLAALRLTFAAHLRMNIAPSHIASRSLVAADAQNGPLPSASAACLSNVSANASHTDIAARTTSKLRVCNMVTTVRDGIIDIRLNGRKLNADALAQRTCVEHVIPVSATNKFEVKLTGQVTADWSEELSHAEMADIPILFLVAHVFGTGDDTTFSVDKFHGGSNGLRSVQVAYMDVYRGEPDAKLQLISSGGEFEMKDATFVHLCAGQYSLRFVQDGKVSGHVDAPAQFDLDEQYVIMRVAPEAGSTGDGIETAIVFPQPGASGSSGNPLSDYWR